VRGVFFAAALAVSAPAPGHDLWLVSGDYRLRPGESTRVFITNGDAFPESLTLLTEHRVLELRRRGPDGESTVTEFRVDGKSLTFEFLPSASGTHLLALTTRPRRVRLKGEDFEDYLAEERLSELRKLREERGTAETAAVERYQKWAKTFVDVGEEGAADDASWSEPAGHPLEIVPLTHPNRVPPGGELSLRVLFRGEPLAGAPISGARASGPAREISSSTDENGEAVVTLGAPGRWYVKAIHLVEAVDDPEVEWDSYWCTLTFEVSAK
jgi:hypothetical protein